MNLLCIKDTGKYGRGVYCNRKLNAGALIETSPVVVVDKVNGSI